MTKIDLKKELSSFYNPKKTVVNIVDVPPFYYLMIDGQGDPNVSPSYKQAL